VELVQDRAPPRVPGLHRPARRRRHELCRDRQRRRADRLKRTSCRAAQASPAGRLGPRCAGGRARRDLSAPQNSATAAPTVTRYDTAPRATTPPSRAHTRRA
jgi:hypothetical protein